MKRNCKTLDRREFLVTAAGAAIAVDPKRGFAGVVLASQIAGKEKTMGPRMQLLELMAN